jgi:hypothetical protein
MSPNTSSAPPLAAKKSHWLLYAFATAFILFLLIVTTVAVTLWWIQRPIKPVVLSASEKAVVEEKLQHLGGGKTPIAAPATAAASATAPKPGPNAGASRAVAGAGPDKNPDLAGPYVPGSKVLKLTEREINGLLNENTDLGKSVRLEFAQDAVNAYVAVRIPEDFPVGGGKMFRARGRFRVSLGNGGEPYAILDDVTVFGLSLPKAWLGGLKGENLIGQAMGESKGSPVFQGIKSLRVEPGVLVLEVTD